MLLTIVFEARAHAYRQKQIQSMNIWKHKHILFRCMKRLKCSHLIMLDVIDGLGHAHVHRQTKVHVHTCIPYFVVRDVQMSHHTVLAIADDLGYALAPCSADLVPS